jgi:hypothetical protein
MSKLTYERARIDALAQALFDAGVGADGRLKAGERLDSQAKDCKAFYRKMARAALGWCASHPR